MARKERLKHQLEGVTSTVENTGLQGKLSGYGKGQQLGSDSHPSVKVPGDLEEIVHYLCALAFTYIKCCKIG